MLIDIFVPMLLVYSLYGSKIKREISDIFYLDNANSLKAIFSIIVVLCHLTNTVDCGNIFWIFDSLGTFAVAVFLFISGYGITKQYLSKEYYASKLVTKRIPKLFLTFILVVPFYILYYIINGHSVNELFLKLLNMFYTGDSIVSNSWYVYLCIELYFVSYIFMKISNRKKVLFPLLTSLFCVLQMIIFNRLCFCMCWYVTTFNFAFGVIYCYFEHTISSFIKKYFYVLLSMLMILLIVLFYLNIINHSISYYLLFYVIKYIVFTVLIVLVTLKVDIHNKMLSIIYPVSFELYLIHGLVLMILEKSIINDFILCILCFILTISLSILFKKICSFLFKI